MIMRACALLVFLVNFSTTCAYAAMVWDNGTYTTVTGANMTTFAEADNVSFASPTTMTSLRFWAFSWSEDFSQFDGTIGWAFHANANGLPGNIVASGFDSTVDLLNTGDE